MKRVIKKKKLSSLILFFFLPVHFTMEINNYLDGALTNH